MRALITVVATLALTVSACGTWTNGMRSQTSSGGTPTDQAGTSKQPTSSEAAASASTDVVAQPSSANPVLDVDFPDSYVLTTREGYVAFATNSRGLNVPTATSDDLTTWTQAGDALPDLPAWVKADSVWAPAVVPVGESYVMYVTVGDARRGVQCIFAATSEDAAGPYALSDQPLACGSGGSIDASPSTDADGSLRLTWKDEATDDAPAIIRTARVTADGRHLAEAPTMLISSDDVTGSETVEAPSVVRTDSGYVLFFSVGDWATDEYRTGYATCTTLATGCTVRSSDWLVSAAGGTGPGGLEIFTGTDERTYAAYHTWSGTRRVMNVDGLVLDAAGTPTLVPRASSAA